MPDTVNQALLRTRLYGGALMTILLRAAYDLARQRALAQLQG